MCEGNKDKCLRHMEEYRGMHRIAGRVYRGTASRMCAMASATVLAVCALSGCGGDAPEEQATNTLNAVVGDTVPLEGTGMSFEIKGVSEKEEVRPSEPSGYFYYYEDIEGWHYYVVYGVIHNPEQEIVKPEDFDVQAVSGGKSSYETKAAIEDSSASTFMGEGDETVGESLGLFLLAMVEDGGKSPEEVIVYYNEGLEEKEDTELWDHGIRISVGEKWDG